MKNKSQIEKLSTSEFLAEHVYLPGYMGLLEVDYDKKSALFKFNVKEPLVAKENIVNYLTPRGVHICISQAAYTITERIIQENDIEELDIATMRNLMLDGQTKMRGIYQDPKRVIKLGKPIQGKFNIIKMGMGKNPYLRLDFEFENKSVEGYFTNFITGHPVTPLNNYVLRINKNDN